ncbi:MBL fold metallo-hydrolase [Facklamia sp. DSM 111018]|uniref:MBL fold metallo-hydrolase n=1 Tax=Facklamia lactis TaxID=2749967 RepID=A0ABS0LS53_9LACT|nr:MBL fold metallo-hydrolase [Facklamia lactis]MBG9986877.1 MBL fold metallo-hydrolase [Facklamia lactis]
MITLTGIVTSCHKIEVGGCIRPEKTLIKGGSPNSLYFPASSYLIEHTEMGSLLVDTGYGEAAYQVMRQRQAGRLPMSQFLLNIYDRLLPIQPYEEDLATSLVKRGYRAEQVNHLLITHAHLDHIGCLVNFPQARLWMSRSTYRHLWSFRKYLPQYGRAFLGDLEQDIHLIDFNERLWIDGVDTGIDAYRLADDLIALDLSGHAEEMTGLYLPSLRLCLAIDAGWRKAYLSPEMLDRFTWIARRVQWSWPHYRATCEKLSGLMQLGITVDICHEQGGGDQ